MKLYFNKNDLWLLLGEFNNVLDIKIALMKFLEKYNYKSYYTRISGTDKPDVIQIDFGSHTSFFFVKDLKMTMNEFLIEFYKE